MSLLTTEAIVLSGIRLGEADKLITFFTLKQGKLKGVAKGVRRMKSRFGASLEPFTHCKLIVFEKGEEKLARINQCDIFHAFQSLREIWDGIEQASRMVHWVMQMTPEKEANQNIFKLLLQGLTFLETGQDRVLSTLLFIGQLVSDSGYQPHWDRCLKCRQGFKPGTRAAVFFSSASGGTLCASCAKKDPAAIEISQGTRAFLHTAQKMDYSRAHRLKPSLSMKQEIETVFAAYLSHITEKPPQKLGPKPLPSLQST